MPIGPIGAFVGAAASLASRIALICEVKALASRRALRAPLVQQRVLLSRQEAAATLAMSLSHFERHVQASVPCVYSGQLRLYRLSDIERWAERHTTDRASSSRGTARG